ncbi:MAG TPA: hypothetical protein VFG99_04645, partial [Chloroflexia bacterium]|nr:hypothetical protein [Chloroflexia bacterium]
MACSKTAPAKKSTWRDKQPIISLLNWRLVLVAVRLASPQMHGQTTRRYLPQLEFAGGLALVK